MPAFTLPTVSDADKQAMWEAFNAKQTTRVPLNFSYNCRVIFPLPEWNPEGYTFQQYYEDPEVHLKMCLRTELYTRQVMSRVSDVPSEPPEVWEAYQNIFNVYDAACFGLKVHFPEDQLPGTEPEHEDDLIRDELLEVDLSGDPLEWPFIKERLAFNEEMEKIAKGMTFEGRPVIVKPWWVGIITDGPVTVGMNLRGPNFMLDMAMDDGFSDALMRKITDMVIARRAALLKHYDGGLELPCGFADDSIAMISTEMYIEKVLPLHEEIYSSNGSPEKRIIHLCGDATRHFPTLVKELGISEFDTGFPVDHAALREELGPDILIQGGPPVADVMDKSPDALYEQCKDILLGGVKEGGRFMLKEGNNLPPLVPMENLEAMYAATLDHGWVN